MIEKGKVKIQLKTHMYFKLCSPVLEIRENY